MQSSAAAFVKLDSRATASNATSSGKGGRRRMSGFCRKPCRHAHDCASCRMRSGHLPGLHAGSTLPERIVHPGESMFTSTFDVAQHNKALMAEIFEGVGRGDARLFYSHLGPNAKMTVTGKYSWSQVFIGKDRIANDLYAYVRSRLAERGKTRAFHFLADGDWVVVEALGDMVTK